MNECPYASPLKPKREKNQMVRHGVLFFSIENAEMLEKGYGLFTKESGAYDRDF